MGAYSTIAFKPERCNGCNECMTACSRIKAGSSDHLDSRIQIVASDTGFELAMCRQCGDPKCVAVCPAAALSKDHSLGVIAWDGNRCVNCLLCTVGCTYGGIVHNERAGHIVKCDMCQETGVPACVTACDQDALAFVTSARIYNEVGDLEDLFVPGLSACNGCNTELIMRHTLRRVGPNTILATPPGCIAGSGAVGYNGLTGTKVPVFHPLLTNTASMLTGVKRHYKRLGREVTAMALAGDGGTSDVGFQSLSGAAERGEEILFVCVDNEGYMNTGMQRSSCTPYGAWTSTTPVGEHSQGKSQDAKNMPVLMMMHNCAYVATASTGFMEDLYAKLDRAIAASKHGFAYLHIYSPCTTGWRFPSQDNIAVARLAVETNFVLLWEFTPDSGLTLSRRLDRARPLAEYLEAQGKYRHLSPEQIGHIEAGVAKNVAFIERLAEGGTPPAGQR